MSENRPTEWQWKISKDGLIDGKSPAEWQSLGVEAWAHRWTADGPIAVYEAVEGSRFNGGQHAPVAWPSGLPAAWPAKDLAVGHGERRVCDICGAGERLYHHGCLEIDVCDNCIDTPLGDAMSRGENQIMRMVCTEMELRAEIAYLRAERQWQPIETAPRDTPVLTIKGKTCHVGTLGRFGWCDWAGRALHPTHWVPLPPRPEVDNG